MKTKSLIAGALGLSLLVAAAPGTALAQDDAGLSPEGVEWTLASLANEAIPAEVETTLFLSGGEVVGSAGCNSYFGSYELDGEALTFPNPFGVTRKFCEGPMQDVEDVYLPLLQATATWSIDDEGALSLADAEGTIQLVYGEAPIDVTATDVDALVTALEDLQTQIDEAVAEVAALAAAAEGVNINKLDKRISAVETSVADVEKKVGGVNSSNLKKRITANEKSIADLQRRVTNVTKRVKALENTDTNLKKRIKAVETTTEDHEARITALESPTPEQPLP